LQALGIVLYGTTELGDAHDVLARDISHRRRSKERDQMVLTHGVEWNTYFHDHLITPGLVRECGHFEFMTGRGF